MARRKDRRTIRAAIVKAAAKKLRCTVKEIFIRATKGAHDIVVNLNKIPEHVVRYARQLLGPKGPGHPPDHRHSLFFRASPALRAH